MINLEKVRVYKKYGGDCDGPVRMNRQADIDALTGSDWGLIDAFFQDIHLISHQLAAQSYISKFLKTLTRNCSDPCSIYFLEEIHSEEDVPQVAKLLAQLKANRN